MYAWFASVREPLPTIAVTLQRLPDDVPLDLQDVVDTVYDRYRYDAVIDYDAVPPAPPLSADDAVWARDRITAWRRERSE